MAAGFAILPAGEVLAGNPHAQQLAFEAPWETTAGKLNPPLSNARGRSVLDRLGTGGLAELWANPGNFPDGGFAAVHELVEEMRARREASGQAGAPWVAGNRKGFSPGGGA